MPRPLKGESRESYIARAIRYMIKHEGLSRDHAVAKAHGMWRQYRKKQRKGKN